MAVPRGAGRGFEAVGEQECSDQRLCVEVAEEASSLLSRPASPPHRFLVTLSLVPSLLRLLNPVVRCGLVKCFWGAATHQRLAHFFLLPQPSLRQVPLLSQRLDVALVTELLPTRSNIIRLSS